MNAEGGIQQVMSFVKEEKQVDLCVHHANLTFSIEFNWNEFSILEKDI